MIRVAFLGGDRFAVPTLQALAHHQDFDLTLVGCPQEKAAGRGLAIQIGPIAHACKILELDCQRFSDEKKLAHALLQVRPDFCVVCAYGNKLNDAALAAASTACVNIHASLLPRWRGAAPIERALLAGDTVTGITTIIMSERIDAGPILLQEKLKIEPRVTGGELRMQLAELGAKVLVRTLMEYATVTPQPQHPSLVTRARKITKQEGRLDWTKTAKLLDRQIRAFNPRPGAYTTINGRRIKILAACPDARTGQPDEILVAGPEDLIIGCGQASLQILEIVPAGGIKMPIAAWLRGLPVTDHLQCGALITEG